MNIPFVDLTWQEQQIAADRERRFADVIQRAAFIQGPEVDDFERDFASYCGVEHCVAVGNGTDALGLIYDALGIGTGDEVITIPTTFIASVSPLIHRGARPVFVDIHPQTRNLDVDRLQATITPRTKAILPVHMYGRIVDMERIALIAREQGLHVIEDACQAHGATYQTRRAGSLGIAAAFSFYPGKNLGAYGDAGAITTNDERLAQRVRMLRNHGGIKKYEHTIVGHNSRLDTLQAVVLSEKLKRLDDWNRLRRQIADVYRTGLSDVSEIVLPGNASEDSVHHLYVIELRTKDRDSFIDAMKLRGVSMGVHYPTPLHLTEALKSLGYSPGTFPNSERLARRMATLPMYPGMTRQQIDYIIGSIRSYFL